MCMCTLFLLSKILHFISLHLSCSAYTQYNCLRGSIKSVMYYNNLCTQKYIINYIHVLLVLVPTLTTHARMGVKCTKKILCFVCQIFHYYTIVLTHTSTHDRVIMLKQMYHLLWVPCEFNTQITFDNIGS